MPTKDSPQGKPDDATGQKPQHVGPAPTGPRAPAKAASDKNNDGKGDRKQDQKK